MSEKEREKEEDELVQEAEALKKELDTLREKVNLQDIQEPKKHKKSENTSKKKTSQKRSHSKRRQEDFDPDRLSLTKDEILGFCDDVIEKWNEDPIKNSRQIFAMNAVRTSILWTDEETLKDIWREILKWAFELLFKNALSQARESNESWVKVFEKLGKNA